MRILDLQEGGCVAPEANMRGNGQIKSTAFEEKYNLRLSMIISSSAWGLLDEKGWVGMRGERGVCFQTR